jgi:hypothetical protein
MRSLLRRAVIVGTGLIAGVVWSGCTAKKATEYVTGISTQVSVPRDIKAIRLQISRDGALQYCQGYRVYDGKVILPRSLGSFASTGSAVTSGPISFTITGVTSDDLTADFFNGNCSPPNPNGSDSVHLLRRSTQPYIPDEIRFLPMPLKYSCYDKLCLSEDNSTDLTCKGGKCMPASLSEDQARLAFPPYQPELADGTGGDCFSLKECFNSGFPAVEVDPATCTYAVPLSASAPPPFNPLADPFRQQQCAVDSDCLTSGKCTILDPTAVAPNKPGRCEVFKPGTPWDGTNVQVVYDGGRNREILDLDADEGFVFSDPANPQRFKLAPGLCEMVKGVDDKGQPTTHRITAVLANGTCQPKRLAQPFCASDQNTVMGAKPDGTAANPNPPKVCNTVRLDPPKSALALVVANTSAHADFFASDKIATVDLPLQDPALAKTELSLFYSPGVNDLTQCTATAAAEIPLTNLGAVREQVTANLLSKKDSLVSGHDPAGGHLLHEVVGQAYQQLANLDATYFRRAVVILDNQYSPDCGGALAGDPTNLTDDGGDVGKAKRGELVTPADPTKAVYTYAIKLVVLPPEAVPTGDPVPDPDLNKIVIAGEPAGANYNPYSMGTGALAKNAKDAFQQIVNNLATCVYDVPTDNPLVPAPVDGATVSFTDPLTGTTSKIAHGDCTVENAPGAGWGFAATAPANKKRILLCKDSCTAYRNVLSNASNFALVYQQPAIAVPLFAHDPSCDPQ